MRAVLETGSMSGWLTKELEKAGVPAVCICARQAHGVLKGKPHKSDRNDALMLARMAHANLLTPVYIRSVDAHEKKALMIIRGRLVSTKNAITNAIRGHLKPFGIKLVKVKAADFEQQVLELTEDYSHLRAGLDSLLTIRARLIEEIDLLNDRLLALAKEDAVCRSLMSIPSVGPLAAVTYTSVIDDPGRFKNSAQIANYLGLTPRRYQSGETDYSGRISKTGDTVLRHLLYEWSVDHSSVPRRGRGQQTAKGMRQQSDRHRQERLRAETLGHPAPGPRRCQKSPDRCRKKIGRLDAPALAVRRRLRLEPGPRRLTIDGNQVSRSAKTTA